jgi:hypothetical protein
MLLVTEWLELGSLARYANPPPPSLFVGSRARAEGWGRGGGIGRDGGVAFGWGRQGAMGNGKAKKRAATSFPKAPTLEVECQWWNTENRGAHPTTHTEPRCNVSPLSHTVSQPWSLIPAGEGSAPLGVESACAAKGEHGATPRVKYRQGGGDSGTTLSSCSALPLIRSPTEQPTPNLAQPLHSDTPLLPPPPSLTRPIRSAPRSAAGASPAPTSRRPPPPSSTRYSRRPASRPPGWCACPISVPATVTHPLPCWTPR